MRPEDLVKVVPGLPLSQARRVPVAEVPCFSKAQCPLVVLEIAIWTHTTCDRKGAPFSEER